MTMKFHSSKLEIFDPFNTPWIPKTWHARIDLMPAPETSRVYGTEISGGPCCVWLGWNNHTDPEKAYGCVKIEGQKYLLHRYAFMCHHGIDLWPYDVVDHLCRRRRCFNPYHHECTTPLENFRRGEGPLYIFKSHHAKLREREHADIPF